jgi:hypothetical protein
VSSVRRLVVSILAGLVVVGCLLPAAAHAHSSAGWSAAAPATPVARPVPLTPAVLRAQPGGGDVPWLLLAGAGAGLLLVGRPRPRRVLGLLLALLLVVLALEHGVHSVHHLGAHEAAACVMAAGAAHLVVAFDGEISMGRAPVIVLHAVVERPVDRPRGPNLGPDPARAPPSLVA